MNALEWIWWLALLVVGYAYLGYPPAIRAASRLFGRDPEPPEVLDDGLPTVSILIAAHDEEASIADRLRNALATDYPPGKLEVVVGSDGSTDGTDRIVREFAEQGVRLLGDGRRRGKAATLNASIPGLKGEVVLLSDANTSIEPEAARMLARWFVDPGVGAVAGRLVLTDPSTGRNVDGIYWRYENFLKGCEGRLGALLGANGAIYAIRKDRYVPIPPGTIVDDFVIPLLMTIRAGSTLVHEPGAVAREETPPDLGSEFRRRSRIGAGGFQSLALLWPILDPRRGWIAFAFLSHKLLRWACPFALIALMASDIALALAGRPWHAYSLAAQVAFYLGAIGASRLPGGSRASRPLRVVSMFAGMNLALLVGFFRLLRGGQKGTWDRTPRPISTPTAGAAR